jgi:ribonuclease Z
MGQITILGTSYSVPDLKHGNTHFLVRAGSSTVLVDCAGDVIQRLQRIDIDLGDITDLIITHFHPDHAVGLPLFLMDAWVGGRKKALNLRGLQYTLDRIKTNMDLYNWQEWPDLYPIHFLPFAADESVAVLETPDLKITASPAEHFMPTAALKFEFLPSGKSFVYSSDTQPCRALEILARNADVLLHEATGDIAGHTSASQAAEIARSAGVKSLYLVHYQLRGNDLDAELAEAERIFGGPVTLAQDFMTIDFD